MSASSKIPIYTVGLGIAGSVAGATAVAHAGTGSSSKSTPPVLSAQSEDVITVDQLEQPVPVVNTVPALAKEKSTLFEAFGQTSPGFTSWSDWYFGEGSAIENVSVDSLKTAEDLSSSSDATADFFKGSNQKDVRSSLRIITSNKKYHNNKFENRITGFGSFRTGNKGFITINNAETTKAKRVGNMKGGFYLVEKDEAENKGNIKYKQEVSKELDFKIFSKHFPKSYWYTKKNAVSWDKWQTGGFSKDSKELSDNVCSESDGVDNCQGLEYDITNTAGRWEYSGSEGHDNGCDYYTYRTGSWCTRIYNWSDGDTPRVSGYDYMYGDKNKFRIMSVIEPFYKGSGTVSSFNRG